MSEWIEIPAHRILKVNQELARDLFDFLGADGGPSREGEVIYRVVRKSDRKQFVMAPFVPTDHWQIATIYLKEWP